MLTIENPSADRFIATDQSTKDILKKGYFGRSERNTHSSL